jgi:hypothetical protein
MGRAPPELQGAGARWERGEGGAVGTQWRGGRAAATACAQRARAREDGRRCSEGGRGQATTAARRRRSGGRRRDDGGRAGGGAKRDCRARERNCALRPINGPLFSSAERRPTKIIDLCSSAWLRPTKINLIFVGLRAHENIVPIFVGRPTKIGTGPRK